MQPPNGRLSLLDVLQEVGQDYHDGLVRYLKKQRCLKSVWAGCRALQKLVDDSLQGVSYVVEHRSLQQWQDGTLSVVPPIQKWERCKSVALSIDVHLLARSSPEPAKLLSLPFVGLTLEARERITDLSIQVEQIFEEPCGGCPTPWIPLLLLLARLPGLQDLALRGPLPEDRLGRQMVFDALAALPRFGFLCMPYCRAVDGVGALAGKLLRLELFNDFEEELDESMVTAIASLRHLQQLFIGAPPGSLQIVCELLRSVPPSLQLLRISGCPYRTYDAVIPMGNGRVISVEAAAREDHGCHLQDLEELAGCVLLPSGAVGPQVEYLRVDRLAASDYRRRGEAQARPFCQQLRALLQRCARVEVGSIRLRDVSGAALQEVWPLLRSAREVELVLPPDSWPRASIRVRMEAPSPAPPVPPPPPQQQQPAAEQKPNGRLPPLSLLPPPRSLLDLVFEHMQAAAAAAAGAQAAAKSLAAEPTAVVHGMSGVTPAAAIAAHLVLLRGPVLAGLAWSPNALTAWVQQLAEQAAAGAGPGTGAAARMRGAARPPQGALPVCACLALLSASALLLQCRSAAAAAAVQAAARAAAEALGGMAGPDNPVAQLQAAAAALAEAPAGRVVRRGLSLEELFGHTIAEVAQAAWRSGALGGLGGQEERLQWLLGQWEQVCGWRAVVF